MYAQSSNQNFGDAMESGGAQSFRRGSYNIPASYTGNAFSTDFSPSEVELSKNILVDEDSTGYQPQPLTEQNKPTSPVYEERSDQGEHKRDEQRFELDDLLLIGIIILLSQGGENSTETLILLALLLFVGF